MLKAVDAGAVAGLSGPASVLTDVLLHLLVLVQVGRVSPVKQMSELVQLIDLLVEVDVLLNGPRPGTVGPWPTMAYL